MTKNKKAICTPTATRAEFESILRELDTVGVKWVCGGERPLEWIKFFSPFLCYEDLELSNGNSAADSKQLPRAEFISAIKRDFAPKIDCSYPTEIEEQPEMNYNKMTKAELIKELKERDDKLFCVEYDYKELAGDLNEALNERDTARATADKYGKQCAELEKANAEQAETIAKMERKAELNRSYTATCDAARMSETKTRAWAEAELARVKRILAQANADVLEGK